MLDVGLLGTGGMMPLPERWLSSVLLRLDGKMLLIDCGEGTQVPLNQLHWGMKRIDAILFTHYHADHIAGLPGLLLTMGNSGRQEILRLYGPPGLKEIVQCLTVIAPQLPYQLEINELSGDKADEACLSGFHISSMPADHNITCLSYSIEIERKGRFDESRAKELCIPVKYWHNLQNGIEITIDGKVFTPDMVLGKPRKGLKVCYCTDTRPTEGLVEFVKESELLICEGLYGNDDPELANKAADKKHMTFQEAARLAGKGNVKELWLTHFSPSLKNPEEYADNARKYFTKTIIGHDLLTKTIKFE